MQMEVGLPHWVTHAASDDTPAWSPDGQWIAFTSDRDGDSDVYITRADGSGEPIQLTFEDTREMLPQWSPDGTKIVYASFDKIVEAHIYVMELDNPTAEPTLIATVESLLPCPIWSLDGTKIAFVAHSDTTNSDELFIINPDGTNLTQITDTPNGIEQFPVWFRR
jgi:Tol biopolymer transport system component